MSLFGKKEDPYQYYDADGYDGYENPYAGEEKDPALRERRIHPSIPLALVALYLFMLVVGIFSTNFVADATGAQVAQVADVSLREERDNYSQLRDQYLTLAKLMEATTAVDQRLMSSGGKDSFALSTDYSALLDGIDDNLKFAKALPIDAKYKPSKDLVVTTYDDEAIYLQKMSKALNDQDPALLQEAFTYRDKALRDFITFQSNMKTFASNVKLDDPVLNQYQPPMPQGNGPAPSQEGAPSASPATPAPPATNP